MLFYIFFLGERGSHKKRNVTKRGGGGGYQIKRYRPLHRGVEGVKMLHFSVTYLLNDPLHIISVYVSLLKIQQNLF